MRFEGNFYGQDYGAAKRDTDRLNAQNNGKHYQTYTNMSAGGYQIEVFSASDDEYLGLFDDGDQWSMPEDAKSKWRKL